MVARGFTLLEILLVIAILGVVAVVAMPMFSSSNSQSLQVAAHAAADSIRFARQESIRTGKPHGINVNTTTNRIRVHRVDTTVSPYGRIHDVYNPLTKNIYSIYLDTPAYGGIDSMSKIPTWQGTCNQTARFYFDVRGVPTCHDPEPDPTPILLVTYEVTLSLGGQSLVVTLHGHTGRVTIQ